MVYNTDKTWDDLVKELGSDARNAIQHLEVGLRQYNEWQSFRAGRDNATIATALTRTSGEIAEMDAAYAAFKDLYDFANNVVSPTQGDRLFSLRVFS